MNRMKWLLLPLMFLLLCGCSPRTAGDIRPSAVPDRTVTKTAIPPSAPSAETPADDPWKVCADSGNSGISVSSAAELEPEELLRRVQITFMIQAPELRDEMIVTRCMNGKLYACRMGADARCFDLIDRNTEPTQAMRRICEELKDGVLTDQAVPADTAYAWGCKDGEAVIISLIREADAAGYDKSAWTEIPAP